MTETDRVQLDPAIVAALYEQHAPELRRFLVGLLRDESLAGDVLQATFAKALEAGHASQEETRKAWLFRVAYHEAMAWRRREAVGERIFQTWAVQRGAKETHSGKRGQETARDSTGVAKGEASDPLIAQETVERIQQALELLPREQSLIVRMRIYEDKKFAEIAAELHIPLGTALARMRAALNKLRTYLADEEAGGD